LWKAAYCEAKHLTSQAVGQHTDKIRHDKKDDINPKNQHHEPSSLLHLKVNHFLYGFLEVEINILFIFSLTVHQISQELMSDTSLAD